MAWEQRGPQTYYYRSIGRHGRVTKDYLGTGPLAELSAAEDAARRAQHQAEAEAWRQERAALDALDRQIDAWWDMSTVLLKATLYTEGHYQHDRGEWRKRPYRGRGEKAPAESGEGRQGRPAHAPDLDGQSPWLLGDRRDLAKTARETLLQTMSGDNLLVQEAHARKCAALMKELAGPQPSPLERLLVERIVLCWLHLYSAEVLYA